MKSIFTKIAVVTLAFCLLTSCNLTHNVFIKPSRPFQDRPFDAEAWRAGDAQTRGEMSKDLRSTRNASGGSIISRKTRRQIVELLGEPDRKTRGRCCGAGGTSEEEVWLYDLEVAEAGDSKTKPAHFQIYFHSSDVVDEWRIGEWDDREPDYFPRVG